MTRAQLTDEEWEYVGPYLPIGEYGPYPTRLRQQFESVVWRSRSGAQWREMPAEFGSWSTVHNRFRQLRDAGAFEALLEGLIAKAAERGWVDLSLVSVDSTTARAHHDAAGMHLDPDVLAALEKAAAEEGSPPPHRGGGRVATPATAMCLHERQKGERMSLRTRSPNSPWRTAGHRTGRGRRRTRNRLHRPGRPGRPPGARTAEHSPTRRWPVLREQGLDGRALVVAAVVSLVVAVVSLSSPLCRSSCHTVIGMREVKTAASQYHRALSNSQEAAADRQPSL